MSEQKPALRETQYDNQIVRMFTVATIVWAGVAFLLGVIIALQLASAKFNLGLQWITFGRLRPLHTNAAIFAFAGNAIFAGIYYSTQRLCKTRMFSDLLSKIHFWGWQLIIVSAALTLPFGITMGKEYAELEWPIDIAIALIWVVFGLNLIQTVRRRREPHIYVAIWFYIATFLTVAILHIVNSIELPVSLFKSYPIYAGVQDALVQWWYGHNAVAFFLTTPFLGLMYYFIPKASGRPVYSYRLSVVHFWSLVFIYIWAGPHHLLNTALPDWAQTLGMAFSVMLWIPSWGGMINGLLTLRGCWDRVRREPVLKFLAAATIFYGMSTFEGPLLSIKSVSGLAHYTDWIVGHVHSGALGWNGFLAFGMIYYLVPKLWNTKLYKESYAEMHFWLATTGIVFYVISMWIAGITQGLMLNAVDVSGKLVYPDFVQTVVRIIPMYWVRAVGGLLFLSGYVLMVFNIVKTIKAAPVPAKIEPAPEPTVYQLNLLD
jgi:cytochrome c oxidase cbb3-type subunit I/II